MAFLDGGIYKWMKFSTCVLVFLALACMTINRGSISESTKFRPDKSIFIPEDRNKAHTNAALTHIGIHAGSTKGTIVLETKSSPDKTVPLPIEKRSVFQKWLVNHLKNETQYLNGIKPLSACNHCENLKGNTSVSLALMDFDMIQKENPNVELGGKFKPSDCEPFHEKVAIIIPYRRRLEHLKILLRHLHPVLQRQQLDYQIFVVEQEGEDIFNRAILLNIGYLESQKIGNFHCYIFHDVDCLVENDCGSYVCRDNPFHFSEFSSNRNYEKWSHVHVGGVVAMRKRVFEIANGYSNIFFGWGQEDDDLVNRLKLRGITIDIPNDMQCYRYVKLKHVRDKMNPIVQSNADLKGSTKQRMAVDGLNSVVYDADVNLLPMYTQIKAKFSYDATYKNLMGERVFDQFF